MYFLVVLISILILISDRKETNPYHDEWAIRLDTDVSVQKANQGRPFVDTVS